MKCLGITVVLGLLVRSWAMVLPTVVKPACDSVDAEAAALVAQDYLNAHHVHGYKYALNRIEDIKILTAPGVEDTYVLEVDLLETDCHVLDPTPLANCTVRPKMLTAVEGDCDVVLKMVNGTLAVSAFKCKTEASSEDMCLGCPFLLPLNDTNALDFVQASLVTFNNNTINTTYTVMEVGRMSSQIVSGGPILQAEYVIIEANCTDDVCTALNDDMAERGICTAKGLHNSHTVVCKMFPTPIPTVDANGTAAAAPVLHPFVQVHTGGLIHHKLTPLHDPHLSGLLSAESAESDEVVPVVQVLPVAPAVDPAPAAVPIPVVDTASVSAEIPAVVVKREAPFPDAVAPVQAAPIPLAPLCPGRVRYF